MSWMFRWFHALLERLQGGNQEARWVEPSNAITRAVLGGATVALPTLAEAIPANTTTETPARPPAIVTRTAQRARRRRASRAA